MRRAKIVATIGPASSSPEQLRALILAGLDVVRVNMSHGGHDSHAETIKNARQIASSLDRPIAILLDLCGPKIRTGLLRDHKPVILEAGNRLTITTRDIAGDSSIISTSYANLPQDLTEGNRILLSDGLIELLVERIGKEDVICRIVNGGELGEKKGINLPGIKISSPSLTQKDRADLIFGLEQSVDYIALSFVRSARDCIGAKTIIGSLGSDTPLIAKIEKAEALNDLDNIISECEGVMVARGDLGVETAVERVPFYQKRIIAQANVAEKLVITATQMLESMTHEPRPTRAEASDVANAILDGTDALMLSAETAVGDYPVAAVETMSRIIDYTETSCHKEDRYRDLIHSHQTGQEGRAIAEAAIFAAEELRARLIVVYSKSGTMARYLAALRPTQRIIAFTPLPRTYASLAAIWGTEPLLLDFGGRSADLLARSDEALVARGLAASGETVVVMAGRIPEQPSISSMMKLHRIGELESAS
ncbi:MAG: pyruvate kinase [Blastocatellia bacterium]|nr:pyruvate kinase [Blastocatellia bacterium]